MKRKTIIVLLCVLSLTACGNAQAPAVAYTPTTVPEFEQPEREKEQTKEPATPPPSPTETPIPTEVPSSTPEPSFAPPEASEEPETVEEIEEPEAITAAALVEKDGTYDLELAKEAFDLVNAIRIEAGLDALTWDDNLYESAKVRALEASVVWSHERPDGTSWSTVSNVCQGENLAKGYDVAADAVNGWMNSQGHKENILRDFERGAVAFFNTENGWFWCEHFGY